MKNFTLCIMVTLLLSANAFAKGHGGGHGGHGGGHHGGHHGGGNLSSSGEGQRNATARTSKRSAGRSGARTLPPLNQSNLNRSFARGTAVNPRYTVAGTPQPGYNPNEHWNSYPYYYYGYYGYTPYYDPYFSMWSFGANFMYTPHYSSPGTNYDNGDENNNNGNNNQNESMPGFAVFEHDTITGMIKIAKNSVSLETKDTARGYDYKFKMKQQGLQYVTVYDSGDSSTQLNLTRLKGSKELLREVHVGKLNIYDGSHGFIYRPEDIDVATLVVEYNGQQDALHSSSVGKTKKWLTDYVNKAYNLDLKPKDFTWKELLIYIDKLD